MQSQKNNAIIVNGKQIDLTHNKQIWWVALKPICAALGVNYDRSFKNVKDDPILSQLYAIQHTTGADGKQYKMLCLPEQFIYGWVFSLQSESEQLQQYKLECYKALYNHFHGPTAQRLQLLTQKTETQLQIEALEKELQLTPTAQKIKELKEQEKQLFKQAKNIDKKMVAQQLSMFTNNAKGGANE